MTTNEKGRQHLGLVYAGEQALHRTNADGICEYCGRLWEELQTGKYRCHRNFKTKFTGTQYVNSPRHPLFIDAVIVIRECQYCQGKREGFCKRHDILRMFLE